VEGEKSYLFSKSLKNPRSVAAKPLAKTDPLPAAPVTNDHILNTIYQRLNEGLQRVLLSGNINIIKYHPGLSGFRDSTELIEVNFDILFFIFDMIYGVLFFAKQVSSPASKAGVWWDLTHGWIKAAMGFDPRMDKGGDGI